MLPGRLGEVAFDGELPRREDVGLVFDELDYQMACQAYLWALPLVSYAQWQTQHRDVFGATSSDLVHYVSYRDRLGLITANATTPYTLGFFDLAETGPLVIELPAGPTAGGVSDFWQRECGVLGEMGPDRGQGGTYVIVPPGAEAPVVDGAYTASGDRHERHVRLPHARSGPRALGGARRGVRIYPYAERDDPPPTRIVSPDGRAWSGDQPRGIAYWERLHDDLRVRRSSTSATASTWRCSSSSGIEKGEPFAPDERRRAILEDGAAAGELMAQANTFVKRFPGRATGRTASGTSRSCSTTRHSAGSTTTSCWSAPPGSTRRSASPRR